ncbi:DUF3530 family protein [Aliiglaciecola sp. M165]|uniref:DUF3530 family protein n=1 Tax=Aliiglaciecola sp. M165 TaxID=2593649 RepID=UPI0011803941|nr:DUF3530 family protein [Aliiglaciecola sp. M165]TRY32950.1 DUF3530 family protein [Aliiglaciecola sp. M165]
MNKLIAISLPILLCVHVFYCDVALAMQDPDTQLSDIRQREFNDSFDVLLAGEQEIPIVIQESNTPITRGVAVLISEAGHNPFSHHGLLQLSTSLNSVGWVTMIMPAPVTGFTVESEPLTDSPAESNASQDLATSETDNQEMHARTGLSRIAQDAFDTHQQDLILRMQAITSRTSQYPGFFLVIAQGTSAAWLTKIYAENLLGSPDGMVALSPHWPAREYNNQLPMWVSQTEMPYLDIYTPWDNKWAQDTVAQRHIQSVKALKMIYRQRELIGQQLDQQQFARLGKEIYGWLTHMGW